MTRPAAVRPLLAALGTTFPLGAAVSLLFRDAGGGAATLLSLCAAGLVLAGLAGTLSWRRWRGLGGLAVAAPLVGLLGATVPMGLLLGRAGWLAAGPASAGGPAWPALLGLAPTAVVAGLALPFALAGQVQGRTDGRLPALLLGLAAAAAFVLGLGGLLSPCNLALDVTLGGVALGLVCGTGSGERRFETWLSGLALLTILALPLSRLVDDRTRVWLPGAEASSSAASQTAPAGPAAP